MESTKGLEETNKTMASANFETLAPQRHPTGNLHGSDKGSRLTTQQSQMSMSRDRAKSAVAMQEQEALIQPIEEQIKKPPKVGKSLPELEKERNQMEMSLTSGIMLFNQRVIKQIDNLEKGIMFEITGLQTELQKEEKRI